MDETLDEQLDLIERVYHLLVEIMVNYSFQILGALIIIAAGFIVGRIVSNWLLKLQERRNVDITLRQFIASTVRLIVIVMAAIVALSQLGISITPFIAALGGLAVGVSLAIQGPVSNYGAGLAIILTRMFRVGDTITVQGCSGLVEEITLATTHLRAEDGEEIIIPNKQIVGEIHKNSAANRVVEGVVGIAYSSDPRAAIAAIRSAIAATEGVAEDVEPQVGIEAFGDSSINIAYRVWIPTDRFFELTYVVNLAVWDALAEAGIQIPFPQREVRMLNS